MKKLLFIAVLFAAVISFTGCYPEGGVVYERPAPRVMVAPPYYYGSPVIVQSYGGRGYYSRRRYRSGYGSYRRY